MHKSNLLANINLLQFFIDLVTMVLSFFFAFFITSKLTNLYAIGEYVWILIVFIPAWMFFMNTKRMYDKSTFMYKDRIIRNICFSSLVSAIVIAALIFFIKETHISRLLFGIYISLSTVILIIARFSCNVYLRKFSKVWVPRSVIVGTPKMTNKLRKYLLKTNIKLNVIGYVQVDPNKKLRSNYHLGYLHDLEDIIKQYSIDEVTIALPSTYVGKIEPYILRCEDMGITVRLIIDLYGLKISKTYLSYLGTFPMLTFHSVTLNTVNLFYKRAIDIIGALVGLTLTALIAAVIMIAIKLESKGPAIFSQNRVGQNGRTFKIYKFRTMYMDAEERKANLMKMNQVDGGFMFKIKDDPRITKVGRILRKTSLDELPQFINVLKGEMSLVGTRPPTLDEVSKYEAYHRRRLSFRPGLTGLWQVSGRSNITDFEEVVRLDTSYIDQWSLWLDIKIILKTVKMVFWNKSGAM